MSDIRQKNVIDLPPVLHCPVRVVESDGDIL